MKKYIAIGLVSVMMFSMMGCTTDGVEKTGGLNTNSTNTTIVDNNDNENNMYDQYTWVGEIVEFGKEGVHIISGDVIDVFEIDKENAKKFYLGEAVGVKEIDGKLILELIKTEEFDIKHTTMGELILSNTGVLIDVGKDKIVLRTDDGEITYKSYIDTEIAKGTNVTVDYIVRDGENYVTTIYNEDFTLTLDIKRISRAENTGIMVINTVDKDNVEFTVYVTSGADVNFNLSDLAEGDTIKVYPESIREIYPAEVDPSKIIKM